MVPRPCRREREPPSGQNHCFDGSNPGDLIRTLSMRNDGGHDEGEAGAVMQRKGMVKTFSEGVSLEEASVLIGQIGRAIEKDILLAEYAN